MPLRMEITHHYRKTAAQATIYQTLCAIFYFFILEELMEKDEALSHLKECVDSKGGNIYKEALQTISEALMKVAHDDFCNSETIPCSKIDCTTCKKVFESAINWWKKKPHPPTPAA